jgi:hypothetical protein
LALAITDIITIDAAIIVGALFFLSVNVNLPFLSPPTITVKQGNQTSVIVPQSNISLGENNQTSVIAITVKQGNQTSVIVPQSNISLGENNQTSVIVPNVTIQTQPSNITQEQPPLPDYLKNPLLPASLLTVIAVAPFVFSAIFAAVVKNDKNKTSTWFMEGGRIHKISTGFMVIGLIVLIGILLYIGFFSRTSS